MTAHAGLTSMYDAMTVQEVKGIHDLPYERSPDLSVVRVITQTHDQLRDDALMEVIWAGRVGRGHEEVVEQWHDATGTRVLRAAGLLTNFGQYLDFRRRLVAGCRLAAFDSNIRPGQMESVSMRHR